MHLQQKVWVCDMTQNGTNQNAYSAASKKRTIIQIIAIISIVAVAAAIVTVIFLASVNNQESFTDDTLSDRYMTDTGGYIEFIAGNKFMAGHPELSSEPSNGTYVLEGNRLLLTYTSEDFLGAGIHGTVSENRLEIMMHHTLFVKK
jgi:hypothetical protein